jgi:uncharacterized protein YdaU (DUF1376 family)
MSKIPYIPLYIGDWEQDTNCLSLQAEAAWLKIIFKMFKNEKSGVYKTSTKSLQNLWKTDTNGVQSILNELIENQICGIETGEIIIFSNRRMIREREISEKRTKAVQNRYKSSTKPGTKHVQTPDIDNDIEYENENENTGKGVQGEGATLTPLEIVQAKEYVYITAQRTLTDAQVVSYWSAYLIHSQGTTHGGRNRQLQHFRNWLKLQPNETTIRTNGKKRMDPSAPGFIREPI